VLTYGLISNFAILIGTNFGERLMYLPSAFFLILIAVFASRSSSLRIAMAVVIVLFSIRTITYAARWNDRRLFYEYSIAQQPDSIRLRMLLIAELQSQGKLDEADRVAADARGVLPEYDEIWIQSADIAIARGDFNRAHEYLDRAMKIRPSNKAAGRLQQVYERRASGGTQSTPLK
jgi:tetratricopeptide (TPR) repeat protein